jgi:proteic killer suppression protein
VIRLVVISRAAKKDLAKVPAHVRTKLAGWISLVETRSLEWARKIPGYHDEPLRGDRAGQRSIRLSLQYRAIYVVRDDGSAEFVSIEEVTPHKY